MIYKMKHFSANFLQASNLSDALYQFWKPLFIEKQRHASVKYSILWLFLTFDVNMVFNRIVVLGITALNPRLSQEEQDFTTDKLFSHWFTISTDAWGVLLWGLLFWKSESYWFYKIFGVSFLSPSFTKISSKKIIHVSVTYFWLQQLQEPCKAVRIYLTWLCKISHLKFKYSTLSSMYFPLNITVSFFPSWAVSRTARYIFHVNCYNSAYKTKPSELS